MIYLDLFLGFLYVGLFTFGGAYGAIPLIRDVVLSHGWLDDEMITYMIAVSESTPGPIMVNLATYIGSSQAGFPGALAATTAVALPSLIIIIIIAKAFHTMASNKHFQALLEGMKPSITGIIIATGAFFTLEAIFTRSTASTPAANISTGLTAANSALPSAASAAQASQNFFTARSFDPKALLIAIALIATLAVSQHFNKKLSPIGLIAIAAALGLIFYI